MGYQQPPPGAPAGYRQPPPPRLQGIPQGIPQQGQPNQADNSPTSAFHPASRGPPPPPPPATLEQAQPQRYHPQPQGDEDKVYLEDPPAAETFGDEYQGNQKPDDDDEASVDFLLDPKHEMTWGRRFALAFKGFSCYNPSVAMARKEAENTASSVSEKLTEGEKFANFSSSSPGAIGAYPFTKSKKETPSLAKAWAYFEHFALPRYVVDDSEGLTTAEPGEEHLPTKLYNPFCTPHNQLGDWGLGVGLYFTTLRALCILTFLGGVVSIPNILYFAGDDYSDGQSGLDNVVLQGSAICTDTTWVPCESCEGNGYPDSRIATGINVDTGDNATFALRNNCDGATLEQSYINLGVIALISAGLFVMNFTIRRVEVQFDEDEQTAQDYSVAITNPPLDAYDPEEWRKFFYEKFEGAHVTTCTVGVDNDLLVNALVERREKLRLLEMRVEPGTSLDTLTLASMAAQQEEHRRFFAKMMALLSPGLPELVSRLVVLNSRIQGLSQRSKPVTNVFVTFETEAAQRQVLTMLSNSSIAKHRGLLFRDKVALKAKEPDEPNTIRWQDLNVKPKMRARQQFLTTFATVIAIGVVALIIRIVNDWNVLFSSFGIAIANVLFPVFGKLLTNFESHHTESTKQRSLYFKIALFRWVNTAVVISIITDFEKTLSDEQGLISQIYALFFAEIVTTNAIQLADIGGHISRHFSAPRAKSQDAMNLSFQGSEVQLAERYTNMTKILLLALWYCSIFPSALFLCAVALFINYYTDRFSLMRTWKRMPHLGPKISIFSRRYFFPAAATAMAVMSSYYWASFPFDNICVNEDETVGESLSGTWLVDPFDDGDNETLSVNASSPVHFHCRQDFFRFHKNASSKIDERFPFIADNQPEGSEWMTEDQDSVTEIWGWVAVGFLCLFAIVIATGCCGRFLCAPGYRPRGEDQGINFSDVPSISSYIPQVDSPIFSYPLVAASTKNIHDELFSWDDPERPYEYYDLSKDAEYLMEGIADLSEGAFSQVVHWPPPKREQAQI